MTNSGARRPYSAEAIERGDLPAPLDPKSAPASQVIEFIGDYFRIWNRKDANALATQIYRVDAAYPMGSQAGIQRALDRAAAEGWDYSTLDAIDVYPWDGEAYLARGLYSRFTADGGATAYAGRLTAYVVRAFPDGLRITDLPLVYGVSS
jgi:hypothetical protein